MAYIVRQRVHADTSYHGCMTVELFAQDDDRRVSVFKALSDPTRIAILRYLKHEARGVTCGEVAERIDMSKSTGSYHFRLLREAGLITTRKDAREKYVSINRQAFDTYVSGFYDNL